MEKSTEEIEPGESEGITGAVDDESRVELNSAPIGSGRIDSGFSSDSLSLGIREPVYEVQLAAFDL